MSLSRHEGPQVKSHTLKVKYWFTSAVSGPFSPDLPPQVHKANWSTQNQMPHGMKWNGRHFLLTWGGQRGRVQRSLPRLWWDGCLVPLWKSTKGISALATSSPAQGSPRAPRYPSNQWSLTMGLQLCKRREHCFSEPVFFFFISKIILILIFYFFSIYFY